MDCCTDGGPGGACGSGELHFVVEQFIGLAGGIYMAGSRLAFERNEIQLHHVLGVKPGSAGGAGSDGVASFPLRPTWVS